MTGIYMVHSLQEGDILYGPARWFHQARNTGITRCTYAYQHDACTCLCCVRAEYHICFMSAAFTVGMTGNFHGLDREKVRYPLPAHYFFLLWHHSSPTPLTRLP